MSIEPLSLKKDYWLNFEVTQQDLEFLYNYLLEVEKPQTTLELIHALVKDRIRREKATQESKQLASGSIYYPKDHYVVGQNIQLPGLGWETAKVTQSRPANNPNMVAFDVITVVLENGEERKFASGLIDHKLNKPVIVKSDDPLLDEKHVLNEYSDDLITILTEELETNADLVRIAGKWFPRALLVDVNVGHLNLAEAVLDMMGGGPLPTKGLMEQIDMPSDVDSNLNEFSLNLALQEDKRFDEVGPTGEVLWYLHRLEPEPVRDIPTYLRYSGHVDQDDIIDEMLAQFEPHVLDELDPNLNFLNPMQPVSSVKIALTYPHWRAGTLPLTGPLSVIFPTALESPRIQFTFIDNNSGEKFPGWVVRKEKYVFGLGEWFLSQGLITGGLVFLERGSNPGEISIRADKKRGSREWIRTAVIGSDGGIVFSMLKHNINAAIDERMAIMISDVDLLDTIWERNLKHRAPWPQTIRQVMYELAKLSPQNHVHVQELYSSVNILRRCPPSQILSVLNSGKFAHHLGNLYFRLDDPSRGDND